MKQIDYAFGNCFVKCDAPGCNREILVDSTDFHRINREIKSYGWVVIKNEFGWQEYCSAACARK